MAYKGYRLRINHKTFPNTYMAKDSWKCLTNKRRLLDSYFTADGKRHEIFSPATKLEINFNIREHFLADHEEIAKFFLDKDKVPITFWNDTTCEYETRVCKISDITWASNAQGNDLFYKAASVVITED